HLETYLSTYFSPNTHLTGEALGLYYLGTLLPEFRAAARWRATGRRILLAQLERHVRPDGVYFEQSSYYHRYTTDFYTHFCLLAQANGDHIGGLLEEKLQSLLDHLMYITRPDGRTPMFGDDDGGRLVMLDERAANDFRVALSTGAALFGRADYKYVSGGAAEEILWLLGGAGLRKFDQLAAHPPATLSRAFPDGGYYVMRDGWEPTDNYLLIDCGPHGDDNCGHAHADALAFELTTGGRAVLIDPGTYTYTGSAALRSAFRSSLAHNTLSIDGESSSVSGGAFTWEHIARATTRRFVAHRRFDFFAGRHDGYERLPSPATHAREVLFIKGEYWMMRDTITTAGAHRYQWHYHFAPHAAPFVRAGPPQRFAGSNETRTAAHELDILLPGEAAEVHEEEGSVSECYGARTPAPVVVLSTTGAGSQDFMTFLMPRGKNQPGGVEWREVAATGGRAFAAFVKDGRDLVMVGSNGRRIDAAPFSSDFAWTWARMGRDELVPEELILIDGGYCSLDRREVIKSGQPIGYLIARRVGDEWLVETDASDMLVFTPPVGDGRVVINGIPDAAGRQGQLIGR
ncbi:MAG: heparinase II/III family protein, partial [Acidobacteriota bacterium]|nr:heparinase II/III family protein [Acidobacteriota bacterium]